MKTIIKNENNILESAHYEVFKGIPSVFINTVHKCIPVDSVGYGYSPEIEKHQVVEFTFYSDNGGHKDSAFFVCETDEEWEILNRVHFECHDKNQLWLIFPEFKGDDK